MVLEGRSVAIANSTRRQTSPNTTHARFQTCRTSQIDSVDMCLQDSCKRTPEP